MKFKFIPPIMVLFLAACVSMPSYVSVQSEIPQTENSSLEKADRIYFLDFLVKMADLTYDPNEQIRKYFSDDFAAFIGKKIVPISSERWDKIRRNFSDVTAFNFNAPTFFQDFLSAYPKSAFLTGRIRGEIKTTSVIREIKDEKGNKRKAFVQQQLWDTETQVYMIDADTGKILLQQSSKDKRTVVGDTTPRFQFERLLEKITERLQVELQRKSKKQERFILLK